MIRVYGAAAIFLTLQLGIAAGCSISDPESGGTVKIKLGPHTFHIPERNLADSRGAFWLDWVPGLEADSSAINVMFRAEEVRARVPEYQSELDLIGTLMVLSDADQDHLRDPSRHADLWYGRGLYRDQEIEEIFGGALYRVRYGGLKTFWEVTQIRPNPEESLPEDPMAFHVAGCRVASGVRGPDSSCQAHVLTDDTVIEFSVGEPDLRHIDEIRSFLISQIRSWRH